MQPRIIFVPLIIYLCHAEGCDRQEADHDEARLHKDLLCDYTTTYRPVKNHKTAINVKIRLALKYLSFDVLEETITVHSWVAMTWKDEFLTWTPSDYGDIKELQIDSNDIWTPRMSLFNADASIYPSDSFYTTCLLANDGTVTCVPHLSHSGICQTELSRWPYDTQKCIFYFGSWMHTGEQVNFTFYKNRPVVLDDYQNGPGWQLQKVLNDRLPGKYNCCPNSSYPMLKYTFILKREAAGPAAIIIVPSIIIVVLTLISLLLDVKDNTRLFLGCFSIFGHFMMLTEIGYDIPKHSEHTPLILLFIRDSMIITLVSVIITLLLMSMRRRVLPAPTLIVSVNRLLSQGPGKYVVFTEFDPADAVERKSISEETPNQERSGSLDDWIQFANIVNSFVFIVTFLVYFILIFCYIPFNSDI